MRSPLVEFLWWQGCPSHPEALAQLREEMQALGLDPEAIEVREVATDADAEREQFVGSPTIRVGGEDVEPPGEEPSGLTCRVYRRPDGRISALPDRAAVRRALERATGSEGGTS
jgi:hypothetical protein